MGLPYEVGDIVTLKKVHPCGRLGNLKGRC